MTKWPRFSIKDIAWLTALVAVIVAWRVEVDRINKANKARLDWYHRHLREYDFKENETIVKHLDDIIRQLREKGDEVEALKKQLEETAR